MTPCGHACAPSTAGFPTPHGCCACLIMQATSLQLLQCSWESQLGLRSCCATFGCPGDPSSLIPHIQDSPGFIKKPNIQIELRLRSASRLTCRVVQRAPKADLVFLTGNRKSMCLGSHSIIGAETEMGGCISRSAHNYRQLGADGIAMGMASACVARVGGWKRGFLTPTGFAFSVQKGCTRFCESAKPWVPGHQQCVHF